MEFFREFNARKLYKFLDLSEDEQVKQLQSMKLLHSNPKCSCGGKMSIHSRPGKSYEYWRCTTKKCRKQRGFNVGTFFGEDHLSYGEVRQHNERS